MMMSFLKPEKLEAQKEEQEVPGYDREYASLIAMVQAEDWVVGQDERAKICGGWIRGMG
jgi:hypothetical protein